MHRLQFERIGDFAAYLGGLAVVVAALVATVVSLVMAWLVTNIVDRL